jgi:hypothetical protein
VYAGSIPTLASSTPSGRVQLPGDPATAPGSGTQDFSRQECFSDDGRR